MASPGVSVSHKLERFEMRPSASQQEWEHLKSLGACNEPMDRLMALTGLEELKQQFLSLWAKVEVFKKQGIDHKNERYHIVLLGNPGTANVTPLQRKSVMSDRMSKGKTTVAEIYADFLHLLDVLSGKKFVNVAGAKFAIKGAAETESDIDELLAEKNVWDSDRGEYIKVAGGVLFIDETYQLASLHNAGAGGAILDTVLTKMEENRGKLAVAFAGYNKDMQTFFEHNQGLRSRIPYTFQFEDFSDAELLKILTDKIAEKYGLDAETKKPRMKIVAVQPETPELYLRIVIRRLAAGRGLRGFGNARAVENVLAQIAERQARRLSAEKRKKQSEIMKRYGEEKEAYDRRKERRRRREREHELKVEILERQQELAAMLGSQTNTGKDTILDGRSLPNGVATEANDNPGVPSGKLSDGGSPKESHPTVVSSDDTERPRSDGADEGEDDTDVPEPEEPDFSKEVPQDDDYFKFTKEDLIGVRPSTALQSPALEELNGLIGLRQVKRAVESMIGMLETNYERELKELAPLNLTLNQIFYGAPGTGKTTVAKLYGRILASLALLSDGEVVVKNPSDFIGNAVGMSESNTRNILAATVGKVLVIDEAYMLASGVHGQGGGSGGGGGSSYGASVIDTIVAEVQGVPGEDRCIILVGYEDRLKDMFQHANPGLARRFRIDRGFRFDNFTTPELMRILHKKMQDEDLQATPRALQVARDMLERARSRASFSNAGEVVNLLDIAKMNFQARVQRETDPARRFENVLRPEDFEPDHKRRLDAADNCRRRLGGRVSEAILTKLLDWIRKAEVARSANIPLPELVPTRFVIRGPAGTGKRTAAREVGRVFYDIGFLGSPETVEKSVSDLLGQYVGHTAPRTRAVVESCLGKALFLRDAARLAERSSYAAEAIGELDSLLSSPKYQGRLVVVLAGTAQEMDGLLAARPALVRLFRDDVVSQPLTPDESLTLLRKTLRMKGVEMVTSEDGQASGEVGAWEGKAKALWSTLAKSPRWENAGTVQELAHKLAAPVIESWQEKMIHDANQSRAAEEAASGGAGAEKNETGRDRKHVEEEGELPARLYDGEDALSSAEEAGELKETPLVTRGILPAEQVVVALQVAIDEHVAKHKASRTARKKKAAAEMAGLFDRGAPTAEMSRTTEPPSLRELATRALAPLVGGSWPAAPAPKPTHPKAAPQQQHQQEHRQQQQQPPATHDAQRRGPLQQPCLRRRTSYTQGPTFLSTGAPPPGSPLAPRHEAGVSAERIREVWRRFTESKARRASETATARRSREKEEAVALRAIMEMGVCPNGYDWLHDQGMWECTGGLHRISDEDIKEYVRKKQW